MRAVVLLFIFICFAPIASAVWVPRYTPCQINNNLCTVDDFAVGANESTCHTRKRAAYNWPKKECIDFLQTCDTTEKVAEKIWARIDCDVVNASIKLDCQKWKDMEYCQWDWLNILGAFVVAGVLIFTFLYCVCGVGNKPVHDQLEQEREEAEQLRASLIPLGPEQYASRKNIKY